VGYVDTAVLNLVERLCRRFQLLTGRTNVWLAVQLTNLSVAVYFVWAASVYIVSGDLALRIFLTVFLGGVVFVLSRTILRESVEAAENEAYRRAARGLRNPRRIRDSELRVAFLSLTIILGSPLLAAYVALHTIIALLTYSLILLTTVLLYVLACDPLPPCEGKLFERVRALGRVRPIRTT
jgi:small-conductance mechanosensitive channel